MCFSGNRAVFGGIDPLLSGLQRGDECGSGGAVRGGVDAVSDAEDWLRSGDAGPLHQWTVDALLSRQLLRSLDGSVVVAEYQSRRWLCGAG